MSASRILPLLLAGGLLRPTMTPAHVPKSPPCRRLCVAAMDRCRDANGPTRLCRRRALAECRRKGPYPVCRPSYTGRWTFTPTGALTDDCGLVAGTDVTAVTTMVVHESYYGSLEAEFGPEHDTLYGYLNPGTDGRTRFDGWTTIGGCVLLGEIAVVPSPDLPRYVTGGQIRSSGHCSGQRCLVEVTGKWEWRPE